MDKVLEALAKLGNASFPGIYELKQWSIGFPNESQLGSFVPAQQPPADHAANAQLLDALKEDEDLKVFFQHGEFGAFIVSNAGRGWIMPPDLIGNSLLRSAARRVVGQLLATDDVRPLHDALGSVLEEFRALVRGEASDCLSFVALDLVELVGDQVVGLPWGRLRAPDANEGRTNPFGTAAPTAILETSVAVKYKITSPSNDLAIESSPGTSVQMQRAIALERTRLTLLLAVKREDPLSADALWSTSDLLGQHGSDYSGSSVSVNPFRPTVALEPDDLAAIAEWAGVVEAHMHPSIQVAVRRTLRAIRERRDQEDALIDAVIAWENLFGDGLTTEMTFRVTTALAHLLEKDPARRQALRASLARVYKVRSKVVHGSTLKPKDALDECKTQAIATAVEALRCLFRDRPDLLSDQLRGERLILEAPLFSKEH